MKLTETETEYLLNKLGGRRGKMGRVKGNEITWWSVVHLGASRTNHEVIPDPNKNLLNDALSFFKIHLVHALTRIDERQDRLDIKRFRSS